MCLIGVVVLLVLIAITVYFLLKNQEQYKLMRNLGSFPLGLWPRARANLAKRMGSVKHKYSGHRYARHKERRNPHQDHYS